MHLDYPLHFDHRHRTATTDWPDHVRDMVEQLIFTSPGERVNRPTFGSGIQQMIFAPNSPELAATLQYTLQGALQQWLGDVLEVQELVVTSEDATLQVELRYLLISDGSEQTHTFELGGRP
jgi:phage baseplate assembly protein W